MSSGPADLPFFCLFMHFSTSCWFFLSAHLHLSHPRSDTLLSHQMLHLLFLFLPPKFFNWVLFFFSVISSPFTIRLSTFPLSSILSPLWNLYHSQPPLSLFFHISLLHSWSFTSSFVAGSHNLVVWYSLSASSLSCLFLLSYPHSLSNLFCSFLASLASASWAPLGPFFWSSFISLYTGFLFLVSW